MLEGRPIEDLRIGILRSRLHPALRLDWIGAVDRGSLRADGIAA